MFAKNCRKIIAVGWNYSKHAKELQSELPKQPLIFLKPPSSFVLEPNPIMIPKDCNVHYELELAVIIGKPGGNIPRENAYEHVKGYGLALDMTARDLQNEARKTGNPWTISKGFDTFTPISDMIPKDAIIDPHAVEIQLEVDGVVRQSASTAEMIFKIPELIEFISRIMTLEENDVILTGTPEGVGPVTAGQILIGTMKSGLLERSIRFPMAEGPKTIEINPLANPKGTVLTCELCGKPAFIQCKSCRVTYYCDSDHQSLDFKGIHHLLCSQLIPLRTPVKILGSEEERNARQAETLIREKELLKISKNEAHKLLFEGRFDLAIPAALQALRFSMLISGQNSVDLIPAYLLLGEASIGLKQHKEAEDYLSLAKWAILKSTGCDNTIKSQLHRNFGQLYLAQGQYEKALNELALDVYYISSVKGPENVSVAGGYFQMGQVFHHQSKDEQATSFFEKVISILRNTLKTRSETKLDSALLAEAVQILNSINQFMTSKGAIATANEALALLAQVYLISGQVDIAKEKAAIALEALETSIGREHSLTIEVRAFLKSLMASGRDHADSK